MRIIMIFIVILVPEFLEAQVDLCPSCRDVGKRSLAIMIAERQGGTAQEWYDRLVDTTFVEERVEQNVKGLVAIGTLFLPFGRVFGWGSKGAIKTSSQILLWGKNSTGHLIKHRDVLGFGHISAQQAQKILPQLKEAATQLMKTADPALTRLGNWNTVQNVKMYISNGKMLVTKSNGEFLTVINKTSNHWYNIAKPLK